MSASIAKALQAEMDALKRLQAEAEADPPSSNFGATGLTHPSLLKSVLHLKKHRNGPNQLHLH